MDKEKYSNYMSPNTSFSFEKYAQMPVVGIIRGYDLDTVKWIADSYQACGFFTLEITMNTAGATEIISALVNDFPEMNIGAGTVCNLEDYQNARNAGAQFIVTPIIDEAVIKAAVADKLPIFPGAYTPSEIYKAWSFGATAVKIFPATQLGVSFIKDIKGPLKQIKVLPTGGVALENIRSFFEVGVYGVGMGSSLLPKNLISLRDTDALKEHFLAIKAELKGFI